MEALEFVEEEPPPEQWGHPPSVDLPAVQPLRWTRLDALLDARNEKWPLISERVRKSAERTLREGWLTDLGVPEDLAGRANSLIVTPRPHDPPPGRPVRFAILGDPGEGDASQYAVVRPFLARHRALPRFSFAVVLSDVIYPAGDSSDYPMKFYGPYHSFRRPIYAIPGNHDWDDGSLTGFMTHFVRNAAGARVNTAGDGVRAALSNLSSWWRLWRGRTPPTVSDKRVFYALAARDSRDSLLATTAELDYPNGQPGPYFRIRVGDVWLICIDTGMTGTIDSRQGDWLLRVSAEKGRKMLLTGKPLIVNGASHPCAIAWEDALDVEKPRSVAEIVNDDAHEYIATIGGDVHNYQRYSRDSDGGRPIAHLVAGGSGAFLASTELIGVEPGSDAVDTLALYPSRALSQVHFEWGVANRLLGSRLLPGVGFLAGLILAGLFVLMRGASADAFEIAVSLIIGAATGVVLYSYLANAASPYAPLALAFRVAGFLVAVLLPLAVGASARFAIVSGVLFILLLALRRLRNFTRNHRIAAVLALYFFTPLLLSVAVPFDSKAREAPVAFYAGYAIAWFLGALVAACLTRKLAAPQGTGIRDRRPYSTVGLAASVWLTLMLVLSSYGTLTRFSEFHWQQILFVVVTGVAVLVAGVLTHLETGRHLYVITVVWFALVAGGGAILFGWGWHDSEVEQQAMRYGLVEASLAVLAGMGATVLGLLVYAKALRPGESAEEIANEVAALEASDAEGIRHSRHELVAAVLLAVGRSDLLGPIFEASDPPMCKSFLDVHVAGEDVTITTYRASGFEVEADRPKPVDRIELST